MDVVTELALGRQAFEERAWATAYRRLAAFDSDTLGESDRQALATAAYLAGDRDAADRALQDSYRLHVESGSSLAAARDTFWLALLHNAAGDVAVGGGWVARGACTAKAHAGSQSRRRWIGENLACVGRANWRRSGRPVRT